MRPAQTWRVKVPNFALQYILSNELGVSMLLAQLLVNRGIYTVADARAYLDGKLEKLYNPLLLKDLPRAVERLTAAIKCNEQILVYGDYDADGITSTALLVKVLRDLNARVEYYIPSRLKEGYGLHLDALVKARERGFNVVVTVDCGVSAYEEVRYTCNAGGPDIIITDHHETSSELPPALAVINPKRQDCLYPFKELAGVGVALKLAQGLLTAWGKGEEWQKYLDLVCVGTIGDVVPLQGENRILVKHGLEKLASTENIGLKCLMEVSGVGNNSLTPRDVGFVIAPRLNAAGRVGDPRLGVELLLCKEDSEARIIARQLDDDNKKRQAIESKVLAEALSMLELQPKESLDKVLVLASPDWHPGVIGIVASRLQERYYRPVLLISLSHGEGKGSARSVPGFHIYQAIKSCREYLLSFGGHAQAAGFSLLAANVENFRKAINLYAEKEIYDEFLTPGLLLDGVVSLQKVSFDLVNELGKLLPFGQSNPLPLLGCREVTVLNSREVGGRGAHLQLQLSDRKFVMDGIGFNMSSFAQTAISNSIIDLAFTPEFNDWQGRRTIRLKVKGIRSASSPVRFVNKSNKKEISFLQKLFETTGESFKKTGREVFIPEFILDKKEGYSGSPTSDFCPTISNFQRLIPSLLVDKRNYFNRQSYLTGLVEDGTQILVLVPCAYQTVELACFLRLSFPSLQEKVAFSHRFLTLKEQDVLATMFWEKEITVLVTTPGKGYLLKEIPDCQIVFYYLPYYPFLYSLLENNHAPESSLTGCSAIHLLFNQEDQENNQARLEAFALSRECLAVFYLFLRSMIGNRNQLMFPPLRAEEHMVSSGFPWREEYSLQVALTVLAELSLLQYEFKGKGWRVELKPPPQKKLKLDTAATFRWVQQIKKDSLDYQNILMQKQVGEITFI